MKKYILLIAFLLNVIIAFSQSNGIFKGMVSYRTDSAVFKTTVNNLQSTYGDVGALYYNLESSPGKWRVFSDSVWYNLPLSTGASATFANNGVQLSGDTVQLGGTLEKNIAVTGIGTPDITYASIGEFVVSGGNYILNDASDSVVVTSGSNVFIRSSTGSLSLTGSLNEFEGTTYPFTYHPEVADPVQATDGGFWYRGDTDKYRGRSNGANFSFVTSEDGANKTMGTAVLSGGTVVVNNTQVTANSRIFLTTQVPGGTAGFLVISARVASTSFTILSSNGADTSTVAWLIIEPN